MGLNFSALDLALMLIVLHRVDGYEVRVSSEQITSLNSPRKVSSPNDKIYDPKANCLVGLTDGKNVQVIETCETIQRMMENAR